MTVALGMKDKAEKETSSFKDEIATLKSQLKSSKRRIQQLRLSESQIPGIKAEFDREQASFQQELTSLKRLLEAAQEQLSKEVQIRRKTENEIFLAKKGTYERVWTDAILCVCLVLANGVYNICV